MSQGKTRLFISNFVSSFLMIGRSSPIFLESGSMRLNFISVQKSEIFVALKAPIPSSISSKSVRSAGISSSS